MWLLAPVLDRWCSRKFFSKAVLSGFKILFLVLALGFRQVLELTVFPTKHIGLRV